MDVHTDDPSDRELRRRQLAKRLVAHRARTQTIFDLTLLTRHQLGTLRRRWRVTEEMRHRGPSPKSFAVFWSSTRVRGESAALAVIAHVLGAVRGNMRKWSPGIEIGERLCEAYEAYTACLPRSDLEFEHLLLLARGLTQGDGIALGNCTNCEAVIVVDLLAKRRRLCSHCQRGVEAPDSGGHEPEGGAPTNEPANEGPGFEQRELF